MVWDSDYHYGNYVPAGAVQLGLRGIACVMKSAVRRYPPFSTPMTKLIHHPATVRTFNLIIYPRGIYMLLLLAIFKVAAHWGSLGLNNMRTNG